MGLARASVWQANVVDLKLIENFNTRADYGDIEELARSIEAHGVRTPLRGYTSGDDCFITDGHRRFKAIQLLLDRGVEIKRVPFIIEPRGSSDADYLLTQLISNGGKPFTPLEESGVLVRLLEYGWTEQEITSKTGFQLSKVKSLLLLSQAPETLKEEIKNGKIAVTTVVEAVRGTQSDADVQNVLDEAKTLAETENKTVTIEHVRVAKQRVKDTRSDKERALEHKNLAEQLNDIDWLQLNISTNDLKRVLKIVKHALLD